MTWASFAALAAPSECGRTRQSSGFVAPAAIRPRSRSITQMSSFVFQPSALIGQRKHVQRIAVGWMMNVGRDEPGHLPGTTAAQAGRHRDVLLAVHAERNREALHRRSQPRLPQYFAGVHIHRFELAIQIAREHHAAGGGESSRQERSALFDGPELLHTRHIERGQLADVAAGPGHLVKAPPRAASTPAAFLQIDLLPVHRQATLAERDDQTIGPRMVAHGLPIVAAFGAGAGVDPFAQLLLYDVVAVVGLARLWIERIEHVLKYGFLVRDVLAGFAIQLPQNAGLSGRKDKLLAARIHQ